MMDIKFFAKSIPSIEHPHKNEDAIIVDSKADVVAVFDGVGGLRLGDMASQAAAKFILSESGESLSDISLKRAKNLIADMLVYASDQVAKEIPGGGTTITFAKILKSKSYVIAIIGHVGDSRAYLFRRGKLTQITDDDSMIPKLVSQKLDQIHSAKDLFDLSYQERVYFNSRHIITQMLGSIPAPSPHLYEVNLTKGDRLILISDGVHDNLTKSEIEKVLKSSNPDMAEALVEEACTRSKDTNHIRAKPDDISAIIVHIS